MAAMAFSIAVLGSGAFFAQSRGFVETQKRYREAVYLSAQKIEELKAGGYDGIVAGQTQQNLSLDGVPVVRKVTVVDNGSLKTVTVSVAWTCKNRQRQVSLTTLIAP